MDFLEKEQRVMEVLERNKLDEIFINRGILEDGSIYREGEVSLNGSQFGMILVFDNRIYNPMYFQIAKLNKKEKRNEVLEFFNELNLENILCKFFISKDDIITVEVNYIEDENFDAELYAYLFSQAFQSIFDDIYDRLMKVMWS